MKHFKKYCALLLALLLTLGMVACSAAPAEPETPANSETPADTAAPAEEIELIVFAAASMTETLTEISDLYAEVAPNVKLVVTVEENVLKGGFGEGLAAELNAMGIATRVISLGVPDRPIRHAARSEQIEECGLDADSLAAKIRQQLQR